MPGGRPHSITPAIQEKIADCFFDGLTDEETALLCDIHERTIRRFRAGELCPAIKKAEAGRKQIYIRKIRDGKQRDWVRIAWFLERRFPHEWAKPETQLNVTANTTTTTAIIITSSELAANNSRLKEVGSGFDEWLKLKQNGTNGDDIVTPKGN
jgi:hypothetical protein